jgi:bacterioferritin-associated ferredoxin
MIVCICRRVSDRDIARVAAEGCASFDELQFELGVATACGKCHDCARETFHRHADPAHAGCMTMAAGTPATHPSARPAVALRRATVGA